MKATELADRHPCCFAYYLLGANLMIMIIYNNDEKINKMKFGFPLRSPAPELELLIQLQQSESFGITDETT